MTQLLGVAGVVDGQAAGSASPRTPSPKHNAKDHAELMSGPEFSERPLQASPPVRPPSDEARDSHAQRLGQIEDEQPKRVGSGISRGMADELGKSVPSVDLPIRELPFAHMRIHFEEFATQLRLRRHHEHRQRMLSHRRRHLQNAVALSARLNRVGSWVQVGLVEISTQGDTSGFSRVHQHMQDLIDLCFSQWSHEIQALDNPYAPKIHDKESFLTKLPASSRADCLELIQTLRCKPRFLVERFKAMSTAQISALSTFPRYSKLSESVLSSLSQNRGRSSQKKRIKAYSKELDEYASSFERSNPLSFLLHNVFGSSRDIQSQESRLRISTWSSICANLMVEAEPAYDAIIGHVLFAFASLYDWQVKDRLELFLMKILQEGAFLLERPEASNSSSQFEFGGSVDAFSTQQARDFFDGAVRDLLSLLACDVGIPTGALHLGCAIMAKLPTLEAQRKFRGDFLFRWFTRDFLRIALEFPEDERMLLQFHIDEKARTMLLHHLYNHTSSRAGDVYNPLRSQPVDPAVHCYVDALADQIRSDPSYCDPYLIHHSLAPIHPPTSPSFLSICAADIAHVLEGLSPQYIHTSSPWDSFLSSSHSAFSLQYPHSRPGSKFDKLRRVILDSMEPGLLSKNIHPCQEQWATIVVLMGGQLQELPPNVSIGDWDMTNSLTNLDIAQEAAVHLVEGAFLPDHQTYLSSSMISTGSHLSEIFANEQNLAHIKADSIAAMYWHDAREFLQLQYPLTYLTGDDTKVLAPMVEQLRISQSELSDACDRLEQAVAELESLYAAARAQLTELMTQTDKLRVKMWYTTNVMTSIHYEGAKNVSTALNNMALSTIRGFIPFHDRSGSPVLSRPSTSGTSASSLFDQPRIDTMTILKAPKEYGGPRKLSDQQIDVTKKWLKRVDNFCKGEERIHRFCMEVKLLTRKLIGETMADSPVLWASELFGREKTLYDEHTGAIFSALPSTRAPSVMSEPLSSSPFPRVGYTVYRGSFYSQASSRTGSDLASVISSPGRAPTVTTLDTGNSIFTPPQSNPRSATSISSRSRPASTFEGLGSNRSSDHGIEKTRFLENLQQDLICLLLSDLGCLVWSLGSETDAWMATVRATQSVMDRLKQRAVMARLLSEVTAPAALNPQPGGATKKPRKRSQSAAPVPGPGQATPVTGIDKMEQILSEENEYEASGKFTYRRAFEDVLARVSHHVDPNLKLKAVRDFKLLALAFQRSLTARQWHELKGEETSRRRSLNPSLLSTNLRRMEKQGPRETGDARRELIDEAATVHLLKRLLFALSPRTIFRDLQYISAFVSSQTLNNTETGRACLHVGLAALGWKDEVCRGMVDVADRIVAKDSIKRNMRSGGVKEPSIVRAAEYWMIAAREGNAIAQRELASLYLTHPESTPIVSMPLALSSDIFKSEMMWEETGGKEARHSSQALCLALHWMQLAAANGDPVAQTKLDERQAGHAMR